MPKDTFFNLPQDKKDKILDAAIDEFAEYTYHKASISRIVERAQIAKGSFYQYFEDKADLFKHLMEISAQQKMVYLQHLMANMEELDFFHVVREMFVGGIKFGLDRPKLAKIGSDFVKETDLKLKEEILGKNMPKSNMLFEMLLKKGIEKGTIDPNIDVELVSLMFTNMSISIGDYFFKEKVSDDYMDIMKFVDNMLYVFENGIKNRE